MSFKRIPTHSFPPDWSSLDNTELVRNELRNTIEMVDQPLLEAIAFSYHDELAERLHAMQGLVADQLNQWVEQFEATDSVSERESLDIAGELLIQLYNSLGTAYVALYSFELNHREPK